MNEHYWSDLVDKTVFLSPNIVEGFCNFFGDAVIMPLAFRGTKADFPEAQHKAGWPIFENGKWYSMWGMRPSRDAFSLALGLPRGKLERCSKTTVQCTNGRTIEGIWTVHHIYECGQEECQTQEKAARFTNLANLVLMDREYHNDKHSLVHGESAGSQWLKAIIHLLYPKSSRVLCPAVELPASSPTIEKINVALEKGGVLARLKHIRENEPAGNPAATSRLKNASLRNAGPK